MDELRVLHRWTGKTAPASLSFPPSVWHSKTNDFPSFSTLKTLQIWGWHSISQIAGRRTGWTVLREQDTLDQMYLGEASGQRFKIHPFWREVPQSFLGRKQHQLSNDTKTEKCVWACGVGMSWRLRRWRSGKVLRREARIGMVTGELLKKTCLNLCTSMIWFRTRLKWNAGWFMISR